ncbi:MAG: AI-2E family transporter [Patescibacteria group bacterium]
MNDKVKFEITTWTIVKLFLVAAGFYFLYLVRDIVALVFIVLILVSTFSPVIKSWQQTIGRLASIFLLVLLVVASLVGVFYIIIPPLVNQISELALSLPDYIANTNFSALRNYTSEIKSGLQSLSSNLGSVTSNIYSFTAGLIGGVFTLLMIFVLTFYILLDEDDVKRFISSIFAPEHKEAAVGVINKIASKIGSWFRGQLLLGLVIFVIDYIGLSIIGIPYALVLALIAGILEIVPTVGPIIAGITAALFALTISPWKALFVLIYYFAVQLVENNVLVPKIMQKAVGISPAVIIIAILIGAKLMGVVGAILAIPLAASVSVLILEWPTINKIFSKE